MLHSESCSLRVALVLVATIVIIFLEAIVFLFVFIVVRLLPQDQLHRYRAIRKV